MSFLNENHLNEIKAARELEHKKPIHVIFPCPDNGMFCGWDFSSFYINKIGLYGGQSSFYRPKGTIINQLLVSQGMILDRDPMRKSLMYGRFKLSFSSAAFSDYQLRFQLFNVSDKWVIYQIVEGPKEVLDLKSTSFKWAPRFDINLDSSLLDWDIRTKTVLAFFPTIPDSIYAKVNLYKV